MCFGLAALAIASADLVLIVLLTFEPGASIPNEHLSAVGEGLPLVVVLATVALALTDRLQRSAERAEIPRRICVCAFVIAAVGILVLAAPWLSFLAGMLLLALGLL